MTDLTSYLPRNQEGGTAETGLKMRDLIRELFPIPRSITGDGVRKTLNIIQRHIPLEMHEVPTGTKVFDWTVPKEWNIRDAYVKNSRGEKVIDFEESNLHVLQYSTPLKARMSFAELQPHLFTMPDRPDWIPYRTSYYRSDWGFCLQANRLKAMADETYEVLIDSSLHDGHLTYGELLVEGAEDDEVLLSTYICHPSLANDNLSGVALVTFLAKLLIGQKLRYSYRFLFIPETIGAVAWLALNESRLPKISHGLVATCVGDAGQPTYKKSRRGDAIIDRAVEKVLADSGEPHKVIDFFPSGSDERQFCSPGFNLPVGSLMRTPYGRFPEYHTSADGLDFIRAECLEDSLRKYLATIFVLEYNRTYLNLNPKGEPRLGERGLYSALGEGQRSSEEMAMLWVLNLSDGHNSLLDIAIRSSLSFDDIKRASSNLFQHGLLKEVTA